MINIPTALTLLRIASVPLFIVSYYIYDSPVHWLSALIFVFAGITDWLDGYTARSLNQMTEFGAFLDPVADKIIVICALMMLLGESNSIWLVMPAMVIITREVTVSALREWLATISSNVSLPSSYLAKCKTALQMVALTLLILYTPTLPRIYWDIGIMFLSLSALLSVLSFLGYIKIAWPSLTFSIKKE